LEKGRSERRDTNKVKRENHFGLWANEVKGRNIKDNKL
jgi:hypothetical protein